ncbi:DUF6702 family protein [Flavobacterium sp.]|uniref:DUF6702 family protein n=1 Tax=Flavobacterium sp. TaxID=239 RepID=UPI002601CD38|nr:DUF6702 family protein [Flavobacterium sp.]
MNKIFKNIFFISLFVSLTAMTAHKFYVGIYQINHDAKKKMIQVTARIFVDDINDALEKKFHKKTFLGEKNESTEDENLLKKYLSEKFQLKVNGEKKPLTFLSKEMENNVLICYLNIREISKIKTLEVENSIITEIYDEQQNIIQANFNGEKKNLLLTSETIKGMLK